MTGTLLLLLPPSETKRDGGNAAFTDEFVESPEAGGLSWAEALADTRRLVASELRGLSEDAETARKILKISQKQAEIEVPRNRAIGTSPRLPALLRYTGVLYDALDAASLDARQLSWAAHHIAVQSALFGLVGGGEGIPAYRLSASSRVGGVGASHRWAPVMRDLLERHDGLVIDLRSKSYAAMGPVEAAARSVTLDVVSRGPDGSLRSLNHFNKRGKGLFTRSLIEAASLDTRRADALSDVDDLVAFCSESGWELEPTGARNARLVVPEGA